MNKYTNDFFSNQEKGSLASAEEIVPIVLNYLRPQKVVDVGCGTGAWLSVFQKNGVHEILGIDGDYVDRKKLHIPEESFIASDLTNFSLKDRRFDLVISLEVAEHIPAESAENFVDTLVNLGPVILFSAAIPGQGGEDHFNEQWPEYWVAKFEKRGYTVVDCLRRKIWNNKNVEWWYAQNIMFFVKVSELDNYPTLKIEREKTSIGQLSIVHPKKYLSALNSVSFRRLAKRIFGF